MTATATLVSVEEFLALPDQPGVSREYDEGAVIEMAQPSFPHGTVQGTVFRFLANHLDATGGDFVLSLVPGFWLTPEVLRAPDVCMVRRDKLEKMEAFRGDLRGCPDLAVEVVSPSETAQDLDRKVQQYLAAGATAVWAIYRATRSVLVYRRSQQVQWLAEGQYLEEPDLLPGLRIAVSEIFKAVR